MINDVETDRWLTYAPAGALLASLDGVLEEVLRGAHARLADAAAHLVRRGGKRLRPALVFLAGAFGADAEEPDLLRVAAAVELLHVASLYHDDVMDRAETRRGIPTVNAMRGDAEAVTAGTFVFARAMRLLTQVDGQLASWASQSMLALALGQMQEAENAYNLDQRLESYVQIATRKTAALFEFSCRAGAHLAAADPDVTAALGLYGRALGLAFQAADDTLDVTAPEAVLGKRPGTDLREGVYGLPVLIALHQATPPAERLRQVLRRDEFTVPEQEQACRFIEDAGGINGAFTIAQEYAQQAVIHIAALPDGDAKRSLVLLTRYAVLRRY